MIDIEELVSFIKLYRKIGSVYNISPKVFINLMSKFKK